MTRAPTRRVHASRLRGFTLTEVLVVIVIIAALVSLLIPAVRAVRESAQATNCLANMRQCAAAHGAYAQDNRGQLPPTQVYLTSNGTTYVPWGVFIANYLERDLNQQAYINTTKVENLPEVARCPSKRTIPSSLDNVVGMARNAHLAFESNSSARDMTTGGSGISGWPTTIFRLSRVTLPSQRVLLMDLHYRTYMEVSGTQWWEMTSATVPSEFKGPTRHNGKANYAFVDGRGGRFAPDSGIVWGLRDPSKCSW